MRYPFALVATAILVAAPASAQFQNSVYIAPYNPGLQLLNDSIRGDIDEEDDEPEQQRPVTQPSPGPIVNLKYTPSKTQTQRNLAKFVAKTREISPANADQMAQIFATTDVIGHIGQGMRSMGLHADNVADAYTLWWVVAWHAANRQNAEPNKQIMASVKRQVETALRSSPQIATATNAQKQEMAEAMLVQAAMIDAGIDDAAGNPTKQAALARAVNQGAMAMDRDLDLTKMTLTQDGFVPRSGGRSDAGDAAGDDSQLAANDDGAQADGASMGDYALYAVAGTGLLAGMFALGKGFSKKG
ncbi:DUF6683 family protein [Pseudonocardia sp. TMWB2A]|uniref:DUF6683 family protein n=1 Tax=Pseudonocardia sp. TMWB2A TaxID=687430 RepID=UPI00307D48F4